MASGFILELGDFKTFGKTDPFCRDKTLRGNRPGGKVMMEIFYFFPNNYLEQLNMVPKCRLRSTSTTQIDKNYKKELLKILKAVWNPFQKKTVLLLYLVNTNEIPDNFSLGPVSAKNT